MDDRTRQLLNQEAYQQDPVYRSQVTYLSHLMRLADFAMADEGVEPDVRRRVLNRLAYGTPSGADVYERFPPTPLAPFGHLW